MAKAEGGAKTITDEKYQLYLIYKSSYCLHKQKVFVSLFEVFSCDEWFWFGSKSAFTQLLIHSMMEELT